jgi:predicted RNase H-like nuclease (RuvC/YqgF family)
MNELQIEIEKLKCENKDLKEANEKLRFILNQGESTVNSTDMDYKEEYRINMEIINGLRIKIEGLTKAIIKLANID